MEASFENLASVDRSQSQVETEMNIQPETIKFIQQAVAELEKRLSGALKPSDESNKIADEPHMPLVPLAEALRNNNRQLHFIHTHLIGILDRLEL